jgi:hypothetical protein
LCPFHSITTSCTINLTKICDIIISHIYYIEATSNTTQRTTIFEIFNSHIHYTNCFAIVTKRTSTFRNHLSYIHPATTTSNILEEQQFVESSFATFNVAITPPPSLPSLPPLVTLAKQVPLRYAIIFLLLELD